MDRGPFADKGINAANQNAAGIVIVNYANQVVRMDMKQLVEQNKNIIAVSMYKSTAIEIMRNMLELTNETMLIQILSDSVLITVASSLLALLLI